MKEREVSLIDLLVEILLSWRFIIVWMLVGAVLMGGFSYANSLRNASVQNAALEQQTQLEDNPEKYMERLAKLENALSDTQKDNMQKVLGQEAIKKFYEESQYLQMDAANLPKIEMTFLIKTSVLGDSYSIERLYEDLLGSGLQQWLVNNKLQELGNVTELVSLDRGTDAVETDSFRVQVIHVSEELCRELALQVSEYIHAQQENIVEQSGRHEIILVNQAFAYVRDNDVLSLQENLWTNIININATVEKAVAAFSEEERAYYDFVKMMDRDVNADQDMLESKEEYVADEIMRITPTVNIKYMLLGMILGAFIVGFYLFLRYILNNKLRINDDINAIYDVPQLGRIAMEPKKKFFGFVDRLILQIRDRGKRIFTREEAIGLSGVAVKMVAKRGGD